MLKAVFPLGTADIFRRWGDFGLAALIFPLSGFLSLLRLVLLKHSMG
jgi:hypothetical protein